MDVIVYVLPPVIDVDLAELRAPHTFQVKIESASGAEHEAVNYTFLGWFFYEWTRVEAEVRRFFDQFTDEEKILLLQKSWTMSMAFLTWPTGKLDDAPPLLANVQVLIAENIFGKARQLDGRSP